MVLDIRLVGRTNVGKSLFLLNFAAYLGASEVTVGEHERVPIDRARRRYVSYVAHKSLNALTVEIKWPGSRRPVRIIDSPGLVEGIDPDPAARRAMAAGLRGLFNAAVIWHVVDGPCGPTGLDRALADLAARLGPAWVLANKADLHGPSTVARIRTTFPGVPVIGVSALTGRGFRIVKEHLSRAIGESR